MTFGGQAAARDEPRVAESLRFGEQLYAERDFYRAITEYKRFLFENPDSEKAAWVKLRIGQSYLEGGKLDAAGRVFGGLAASVDDSRLRAWLITGLARVYYLQGRYAQSLDVLENGDELTSGHGVKNQSLYLQACAHLKSGQTRLAREKLESIWSGHDLAERATRLLWEVERAEEIPHKSPVVAGLLSIVPGLGHFYMEDYAVAITALTWNGLFGFATYDAFRRSSYGVGAVLAALELFWYSGTIYGAVAEAHRYNRDARKNYIERLDEAIGLDVDFPDSRVVGGILLEGEF